MVHISFLMTWLISKILIQTELRYKSYTKILLMITLGILLSKILAMQNLIVQILCILLLIKQIDTLKKPMEINI